MLADNLQRQNVAKLDELAAGGELKEIGNVNKEG
jgi:hypothetical protein